MDGVIVHMPFPTANDVALTYCYNTMEERLAQWKVAIHPEKKPNHGQISETAGYTNCDNCQAGSTVYKIF